MKENLLSFARAMYRKLPVEWRSRGQFYSAFERHPQFRAVRQDLHRIPMSDGAFVDVFWKALPIGRGPAASVVIANREVLRLDCFGPGEGHMHVALCTVGHPAEDRLFLPEPTVEQQIDRIVFEVTKNLYYYTQRSPHARVRAFQTTQNELAAVGQQMREKMKSYIAVSTLSV